MKLNSFVLSLWGFLTTLFLVLTISATLFFEKKETNYKVLVVLTLTLALFSFINLLLGVPIMILREISNLKNRLLILIMIINFSLAIVPLVSNIRSPYFLLLGLPFIIYVPALIEGSKMSNHLIYYIKLAIHPLKVKIVGEQALYLSKSEFKWCSEIKRGPLYKQDYCLVFDETYDKMEESYSVLSDEANIVIDDLDWSDGNLTMENNGFEIAIESASYENPLFLENVDVTFKVLGAVKSRKSYPRLDKQKYNSICKAFSLTKGAKCAGFLSNTGKLYYGRIAHLMEWHEAIDCIIVKNLKYRCFEIRDKNLIFGINFIEMSSIELSILMDSDTKIKDQFGIYLSHHLSFFKDKLHIDLLLNCLIKKVPEWNYKGIGSRVYKTYLNQLYYLKRKYSNFAITPKYLRENCEKLDESKISTYCIDEKVTIYLGNKNSKCEEKKESDYLKVPKFSNEKISVFKRKSFEVQKLAEPQETAKIIKGMLENGELEKKVVLVEERAEGVSKRNVKIRLPKEVLKHHENLVFEKENRSQSLQTDFEVYVKGVKERILKKLEMREKWCDEELKLVPELKKELKGRREKVPDINSKKGLEQMREIEGSSTRDIDKELRDINSLKSRIDGIYLEKKRIQDETEKPFKNLNLERKFNEFKDYDNRIKKWSRMQSKNWYNNFIEPKTSKAKNFFKNKEIVCENIFSPLIDLIEDDEISESKEEKVNEFLFECCSVLQEPSKKKRRGKNNTQDKMSLLKLGKKASKGNSMSDMNKFREELSKVTLSNYAASKDYRSKLTFKEKSEFKSICFIAEKFSSKNLNILYNLKDRRIEEKMSDMRKKIEQIERNLKQRVKQVKIRFEEIQVIGEDRSDSSVE